MVERNIDRIGAGALRPRRSWLPVTVALLGFVIVGPSLLNAYWTKTFTSVACLTLASASVAALFGQLGMVSLCQFAIAGVGGWITLRLIHGWDLPFEVALLAGGVAASAFGLVTGLPAMRMRGLYLALVSLMVAAAFQVVINVSGFPDGGPGWLGKVVNGQRALIERPWAARGDAAYLRYVLAFVVAGLVLIEWHRASMPGRAWALIRKGEAAATAAGVNVVAYKAWAFALAGFLAGISGGLLAGSNGQLDNTGFPVAQSILLFALTVVGGAYHWVGAVFAALLMRALPALLTDSGVDGNLANVFFGFALIVSLIQGRKGIAGQLADLYRPMPTSVIVEGVLTWGASALALGVLTSLLGLTGFWPTFSIALIGLLLHLAAPGILRGLLGFARLQRPGAQAQRYLPTRAMRALNALGVGGFVAFVAWGVFDVPLIVGGGVVWLAICLKTVLDIVTPLPLAPLCRRLDRSFGRGHLGYDPRARHG